MRSLIIEDEDHTREVAQVSLEVIGGWDVLMASTGKQRARVGGMPVLVLTKSRVPPEAFEQRILHLLGMNGDAVHPPAPAPAS